MSNQGSFALGVGWSVCANGETFEFWLTFDGTRIERRSVFKTPEASLHATALAAFRELCQKDKPRRDLNYGSHPGR